MRYIIGRTYWQGSVLFVQRPQKSTETVEQARLILASDISTMDEAMEVAREYGIVRVHRILDSTRRAVGVGWPS